MIPHLRTMLEMTNVFSIKNLTVSMESQIKGILALIPHVSSFLPSHLIAFVTYAVWQNPFEEM